MAGQRQVISDGFPEPLRTIMHMADVESDRFGHNYIGCEHLLVVLAQTTGPPCQLLTGVGLTGEAIRAQIGRLVDAGVLPAPWHNDATLLRGLGVDLDDVIRSARDSFGDDAVDRASRRVSRQTGWTPLCGKALMVKQALSFAGAHRRERGAAVIEAEDLLIGVLRDAEDPVHRPRCFDNPWRRRLRSRLGLPVRGPSPVRLIVEASGATLVGLRAAATSEAGPVR